MRPRQFEEAEILRIAFDRFWRQGVRGTSLADIARDSGVQRGSLYNAFGSKEALFLAAYGRYKAEYLAALERALSAGTLRARLDAFFEVAIASLCAGSPPRGCPTTRGLMEVGTEDGGGLDAEAREAFADLLRQVVALVEAALREGAARGEFEGDPAMAAWHLVTVARGLVVVERAFGEEAHLRRVARHAVETELGGARAG